MALAVAQVGGNVTTVNDTITGPSWTTTSGSLLVSVGHLFAANGAAANGDMTDSKSNSWTLAAAAIAAGATSGVGVWYQLGGTRGASHTVTYNPTAGAGGESLNIAVIEITGADTSSPYDSTTTGTSTDTTDPLTVTAGGAISGNQIAIYGITLNDGNNRTWGAGGTSLPTGYTNIIVQGNGAADLISAACYKINETGTPTLSSTWTSNPADTRSIIVTFKEAGAGGTTNNLQNPNPVERLLISHRTRWF